MRKLLLIIAVIISVLVNEKASAQVMRLPSDFTDEPRMIADAHNSLRNLLPEISIPEITATGDETDRLAADLLEYAHSFIGTRYRRGGKTPAGFDCSGFTGYVFREFGYSLSASSAAQYYDGHKVPIDEIQPGDLLFFNGRARGSRVGHVGIAISADPVTGIVTFIHSSTSRGVRVDRTDTPYYSTRFLGARRILPD